MAVTELIFWASISPGANPAASTEQRHWGSCLKALIGFRWVLTATPNQWDKAESGNLEMFGSVFFFKFYWKLSVLHIWYFFLSFCLLLSWHGFLLLCFWIAQWVTRNNKWINGWRMQAVKQAVFTGREGEQCYLMHGLLNTLLLQIFQKLLFRRQCYFTRNLS